MRMGHKRLRFVGLIAVAMVLVAACGSSSGPGTPTKTFKIGLVTDTGGLNDKSFNHLADVGLEKAKTDFKIQGDVKESKTRNHYIAGYKWAAKMEDPSISVLVGYSNNFNDPAKCKSLASAQINQKSDIVFQVAGGCGLGALQQAGQSGVYGIGVDADQKDADPSVIASALKKVDVATYTAIHNVVQGQFQGGALTFSIANDGAGYAVDNFDLPADLKAKLDKVQGQIKSGALTPPADIPA